MKKISPVNIDGDMVRVPLGGKPAEGGFAIIDLADLDLIAGFRWCLDGNGAVMRTTSGVGGKQRRSIFMHRVIAGTPDGMLTDHIDHNKRNNRRDNLRICTNAENCRNRKGLDANNTTGYRGVYFHKNNGKFRAHIQVRGRRHHLGYFATASEAGAAFDVASRRYYGEFYEGIKN